MNLAETLQLLDKLNSVGAKHFKSQDFEVSMASQSVVQPPQEVVQPKENSEATATHNAENTRKAEALIDLLKRKDEEILNTIFPEGA